MVKNMIAVAMAASVFFAVQADAQTKYFARVAMSGLKDGSGSTPAVKPVASCGALIKGWWFASGTEKLTGDVATTEAQANAFCAKYAQTGQGACGWTNSAYYGDEQYKMKWSTSTATRQLYDPKNPEDRMTWAVHCPAV